MIYDNAHAKVLRAAHHAEITRRLQSLMQANDVQAMVFLRGDDFNWINGHQSAWLEAGVQGLAMIVVPQEGAPVGLIADQEYNSMIVNGAVADWRTYKLWSGWETRYSTEKPIIYASDRSMATFEGVPPSMAVLQDVLREMKADTGRIAIDLSGTVLSVYQDILKILPDATLVNVREFTKAAVPIKTEYEIYNLRHCAFHQWRVTHEIMSNIKVGDRYGDIRKSIEAEAAATPDIDRIYFFALYMGKMASGTMRSFDIAVQPGDFISIDLGFTTCGYVADSGRAYVAGPPTDLQRKIADVYGGAHELVREQMKPGARLGDLFALAEKEVRRHDISDFKRGHIGHSLGCNYSIEEYPYTSRDSEEVLKPGMVMTLEVPFYGRDYGTFFQEDILLITDTGSESLTSNAPMGLNVIDI